MARPHTCTHGRRLSPNLPEGALPSDSSLLDPLEVKAVADALGTHPTKVLGQNFVHDAGTVRRIVRAGRIQAGDEVVEIGPGSDSLTLAILEKGARVHAIGINPMFARALPETIRSRMPETAKRFHVVLNDATKVEDLDDFGVDWPTPTRLIASLPYNVAVPILLAMLESFPNLSDVLVIIQFEIADHLAASSSSRVYGVPLVKVVWYRTTERAGAIGRSVSQPVPNVDSALVRLRQAREPRGEERLYQATFEVCDVTFRWRRKTLRATLKTWADSTQGVEALLERADIGPSTRRETLSIGRFVALGRALIELRGVGVLIERIDPRNGESPRPNNEVKTTQSASSTLLDSPVSDSEVVDNT